VKVLLNSCEGSFKVGKIYWFAGIFIVNELYKFGVLLLFTTFNRQVYTDDKSS